MTAAAPLPLKSLVEAIDARLTAFHAARLEELGPDAGGLFSHYEAMVRQGSLLRRPEIDRITYVVKHLPAYDHYVVYRAGLGEIALALAATGRRVTAWEPNRLRRQAIEAGFKALAGDFPRLREHFAVAGDQPGGLGANPHETSLGIGLDMLLLGKDDDEAGVARATVSVHALLYEPRLFLKVRDDALAEAECRAVLQAIGFDSFRPTPVGGLHLATRGAVQPTRALGLPGAHGSCKGVFTINGASYSGSTLLNALLGSHPAIAGGGELHWLATEFERGVCSFCREACRVWTPEVRASINHENLYHSTAAAFGRPYVADASKKPDWFKGLLHLNPGLEATNILIVKHPVRHVASFLHKATFKKDGLDDPVRVLQALKNHYDRTEATLKPDMVVRYEDLAADPKAVLSAILATRGLAWDDAIDDWQAQPHHHIGGNAGPRSQIARAIQPSDEGLRRKYARDGVFLDDSYLEILDEPTFERIVRHPIAVAICETFGYGPVPFGKSAA
jgi:hypothetical protein